MTNPYLMSKSTSILHQVFVEKLAINASSGASVASSAFASGVTMVRLVAEAACNISFGAAPTAATGTDYLPANTYLDVRVAPGSKVAALAFADSATKLYISHLDSEV